MVEAVTVHRFSKEVTEGTQVYVNEVDAGLGLDEDYRIQGHGFVIAVDGDGVYIDVAVCVDCNKTYTSQRGMVKMIDVRIHAEDVHDGRVALTLSQLVDDTTTDDLLNKVLRATDRNDPEKAVLYVAERVARLLDFHGTLRVVPAKNQV